MTIEQLIQFTQNQITNLEKARTEAFGVGDLTRYAYIESELAESKTTLASLALINKPTI